MQHRDAWRQFLLAAGVVGATVTLWQSARARRAGVGVSGPGPGAQSAAPGAAPSPVPPQAGAPETRLPWDATRADDGAPRPRSEVTVGPPAPAAPAGDAPAARPPTPRAPAARPPTPRAPAAARPSQPAARLARSWLHPRELWQLLKASGQAWSEDYAASLGAALSYYTLFSIGPLLLIVISVAGIVFGDEAARGAIFQQLRGFLGPEGATAVEGLLESASLRNKGIVGTVVGVVLLVLGATRVLGELQSSLDRIWRAPERERKQASGWRGMLRTKLLSVGMVLGLGFLLTVSLAVSAALAAFGRWWAPMFGELEVLLQAANFVSSLAMITVIFALMYKLLPSVEVAWSDVWVGAAFTAVLFTIGKTLIGIYIGTGGVTSGFGAASSVVVVMVWVYYSAQIFFVGAEFTWVYAHRFGSRRDRPAEARQPAPERRTQ